MTNAEPQPTVSGGADPSADGGVTDGVTERDRRIIERAIAGMRDEPEPDAPAKRSRFWRKHDNSPTPGPEVPPAPSPADQTTQGVETDPATSFDAEALRVVARERDEARSALTVANEQLAATEQHVTDLTSARARATKTTRAATSTARLTRERDEAKAALAQVTEALAAAERQVSELTSAQTKTAKTTPAARTSTAKLTRERDKAKAALAEVTEQLTAAQNERVALTTAHAQSDGQAQATADQLTRERDQAQTALATANQQLATARQEHADLTATHAQAIADAISQAQATADQLTRERDEATTALTAATEQHADLLAQAKSAADADTSRVSEERDAATAALARVSEERDRARTELAELTRQRGPDQSAPADSSPPSAPPEPTPSTDVPTPEPASAAITTPPPGQDVIRFATTGSDAPIYILGVGALVAAGCTVFLGVRDQLTSTAGIISALATLLLAVVLSQVRIEHTAVWIKRGLLTVEGKDGRHQFDLTKPSTLVQLVGQPGERGWKVLFVLKDAAPYAVDATIVDPAAFTEAVRRWRPNL